MSENKWPRPKWWTWLFGKELTPHQIIRRNQRLVNKAIRNVERERYNLERQEQKQILEIKRMAQKNQPEVVRAMANDLVRLRNQIKKLLKMKQNLQGVSLQLQTLESQQSISQALCQATMVLRGMNRQLNMPRIKAILKEFEKQTQIMEIKEEIINETMDEVAGQEEDGEESDEIVTQILDELGLQLGAQLPETPHAKATPSSKAPKQAAVEVGGEAPVTNSLDDELLARLEKLRKT